MNRRRNQYPGSGPETGGLLELLPDEPADEENQTSRMTPTDLIERFLRVSPSIERMTPENTSQ